MLGGERAASGESSHRVVSVRGVGRRGPLCNLFNPGPDSIVKTVSPVAMNTHHEALYCKNSALGPCNDFPRALAAQRRWRHASMILILGPMWGRKRGGERVNNEVLQTLKVWKFKIFKV